VGLVLPTVFANALASRTDLGEDFVLGEALKISRAVAIILLIAFFTYTFFQSKSHDSLFAEIFTSDEHKDEDRHKDLAKEKLTLTECIIALVFALACVSLIAVFLVLEIEFMVEERHVADAFVGLILIPLVEKFAGKLFLPSLIHASIIMNHYRTSNGHRRSLGQPNELRSCPRSGRLHSDRFAQHSPRHHRRMGTEHQDGHALRSF
jgi:hypothetical protein